MRHSGTPSSLANRRHSERGNMVLVAALIVLAMGGSALMLGTLLRTRVDHSADLRLSNYAGTLAQNVAESGLNAVLFNWNTSLPLVGQPGPLPAFPSVQTTYAGIANPIQSDATYSVTIAPAGPSYRITVTATASSSSGGSLQTVSRTIEATASILDGGQYSVAEYRR